MRHVKHIHLDVLLIALSLVGFVDAVYLTANRFLGRIPQCTIKGCEIVATSEYAAIFRTPIALVGVLYYGTLFLLAILYRERREGNLLIAVCLISVVGFLMSAWFTYLQFFVINAVCSYCLLSAGTTTLIMCTSLYGLRGTIKRY